MEQITETEAPAISVLIPASNEAALIGGCLGALCASDWPGSTVEVIVVANGCTDDTAARARACADRLTARGWRLRVIERAQGGKLAALNDGDAAASAEMRAYLDADVAVSPPLLRQIHQALDTTAPRYASGRVQITAQGRVARAYARIYRQVPFMTRGVPGCGLFAVNAAGRRRWGGFPQIISDDTFVRLQFAPEERVPVPAGYRWPLADGFGNLVRVRRRQDAGVDEIVERFPELMANDDKPAFPVRARLRLALRDPLGFAVYSAVALISRLTRHRATGWSRGR